MSFSAHLGETRTMSNEKIARGYGFALNGKEYELTITDPKAIAEIEELMLSDGLSDEEFCLLLGSLYYEFDPEYGHAFLLHVFGDEETILKKMWKCPLPNVEYVLRCARYMKEHSKP